MKKAKRCECGRTESKFIKGKCAPCYEKAWRGRNPEKVRAYKIKWIANNPEKYKASLARYAVKWRAMNPNYSREYQAKNREKLALSVAIHRALPHIKEKRRAYMARWYVENRKKPQSTL